MHTKEANDILNSAIESVEKNGISAETLIPQLQAAREHALQENDPLVTRAADVTQFWIAHNKYRFNFVPEGFV